MTDEEIIERFKKADELLARYKETILPAARELADRKSQAVFGSPNTYDGRLGCFESGDDTVCLHLVLEDARPTDEQRDKAHDFTDEWYKRLIDAGIRNVSLNGFY